MHVGRGYMRQLIGTGMVLLGVLLIFVCLPVEAFLITLGAVLAIGGIVLLE